MVGGAGISRAGRRGRAKRSWPLVAPLLATGSALGLTGSTT
jgi:hypothetical protein